MMDESDKRREWAKTAIQNELKTLSGIHDENAHKPSSEYWKCLLRLGSVLKGAGKSHFTPSQVLTAVLRETSPHMQFKGDRNKDITYLFGRAYNVAQPRFPLKNPPIDQPQKGGGHRGGREGG